MSAFTPLRLALLLAAAAAISPWASAQYTPPGPPTHRQALASCPAADAMKASQLFGRWAVRYSNPPPGLPATATMLLERHAEFSESLAGTVSRPASQPASGQPRQAALAGDLDGGLLLLDESSDNIRITASWNGEMVPGSCGTAFAGQWKDLSTDMDNMPDIAFTLTRLP